MREDYLHYIWKNRLFEHSQTGDERVEVLDVGRVNLDAGPDFFNCKIKIGDTVWAGNVEIHFKSSDWNRHNHQLDPAYNNVILHVVYEHDQTIFDSNGREIPVFEVREKYNESLFSTYTNFIRPETPCLTSLDDIPELILINAGERYMIRRLQRKSLEIESVFNFNNKDLEETFFQFLVRSLGTGLNGDSFFMLARNTPIKILRRSNDNEVLESLLFGNAGLINNPTDQYSHKLFKEYSFLKKKYKLKMLESGVWKFSKIRPANFPTVRIAQLTKLISSNHNLFDRCIKGKPSLEKLYSIFEVIIEDGYWLSHYSFGKQSKERTKSLGKSVVNNIIINVVVPFGFFYSEYVNNHLYKDYVLNLLEELPPEENRITKIFNDKIPNRNAFTSQSLIEMYTEFCQNKKCLQCNIGLNVLNKKQDL